MDTLVNRQWLDEIGHIHWHFINLRVVKRLNIFQHTLIIACNKVYGYSLTAKSATTADPKLTRDTIQIKQVHYVLPVNVVLSICWQVVVYY